MADGGEADSAAEGLAPEAGAVHAQVVQDGEDVGGEVVGGVHGGVVWLGATAAAAAVDQHQGELAGQGIDVAGVSPGGGVPDEPV